MTSSNELIRWGRDPFAGSGTDPQRLGDLSNVEQVDVGHDYVLALKSDGTVWAWGSNPVVPGNNSETPAQVSGLSDVTDIAAGPYFALALTSAGEVYAWGDDGSGQLGNGAGDESQNRSTPVQVSGISNATAIAAGAYHGLAIVDSGDAVKAWGENSDGELATGGTTDFEAAPVDVTGLGSAGAIEQVSAGASHSMALDANGAVYTWGSDGDGQLGNGATTGIQTSAINISGQLDNVDQIAAGGYYSVALKGGNVHTWGEGGPWLGLGSSPGDHETPIQVGDLDSETITTIDAGSDYTMAIDDTNGIWVWGNNDYVKLGTSGGNKVSPSAW
mgnify:CR=1 FL=1